MDGKTKFLFKIEHTDGQWDIQVQGSTDVVVKAIATSLILAQLYLGNHLIHTNGKSPPETISGSPTKIIPAQSDGGQNVAAPDRQAH
jgi:hypothetical protein